MDKYVICDIDGTIANAEHRLHLVKIPHPDSKGFKPDWDAFFDACVDDKPIDRIIFLVSLLYYHADHTILFVSGRSDRVRQQTAEWLAIHGLGSVYDYLGMRKHGDHRPDDIVKREIYETMKAEMGFKDEQVSFVLDDRDRVVRMWRDMGLTCLQVAEGAF
jgi:hypothetical protein